MTMDVGQAIKTIRKKQGMSQQQLAEKCGMSINGVSLIETGQRFPAKSTVERLCQAFGIPKSYLMLATIEEQDIPEEKRLLYRTLVEPLRDELLEKPSNENV